MREVANVARAPGWWWPLRDYRGWLLCGGLPVAGAVAVLLFMLEPVFESRALVEVQLAGSVQEADASRMGVSNAEGMVASARLLHAEFMNTQREVMASATVAGAWRQSLRVEVLPQTRILAVHYQAHDPQLAREGADSVVRAYVDYTARTQVAQISDAAALLIRKLEGVIGAPGLELQDVGMVEEPFAGLPTSAELLPADLPLSAQLQALEDSAALGDLLGTTLVQQVVASYDESLANLTNVRVIDPASLPQQPLEGPHPLWILLGYFSAVAIPAAVLVARFRWRDTLDFPHDIQRQLQVPCLGGLPAVAGGLTVPLGPETLFSTSVRSLRTALQLLRPPREALEQFPRGRIVLVTSGCRGEGKTTVATSLALALGRMEKVLLIDADMRSGRRCLGVPAGAPGLSHLIAGAAQLRDCVHSRADLRVDVIPAGVMPPNPQELLASKRFRRVLDVLERRYDTIVVDTPALNDAKDTLQLARYCSDLLFVIAAGATHVLSAKEHLQQLEDNGVRVSGVVLNRIKLGSESAGSGLGQEASAVGARVFA